jgi:hypothetical protein
MVCVNCGKTEIAISWQESLTKLVSPDAKTLQVVLTLRETFIIALNRYVAGHGC